MSKIKEVLTNTKVKVATAATAVGGVLAVATPAFAADENIESALSSGLSQVSTDILGYIAIALPIGLGIFGAFFGIKKIIGFFRAVAK